MLMSTWGERTTMGQGAVRRQDRKGDIFPSEDAQGGRGHKPFSMAAICAATSGSSSIFKYVIGAGLPRVAQEGKKVSLASHW